MLYILSSITIQQQIQDMQHTQVCSKQLILDDNKYSYCQKAHNINGLITNDIVLSKKVDSIYIYSDAVQQSIINVQMLDLDTFAVFGFNIQTKNIFDSVINVTINFSTVTSALICIQCDVQIESSVLVFIANGSCLSGILSYSQNRLIIQKSAIQFRFSTIQAAGIVIRAEPSIFTLSDTNISGFNYKQSEISGLIASENNAHLTLNNILICTQMSVFGSLSKNIVITGIILNCITVCQSKFYVYGICLQQLEFGTLNKILECVHPFIFNGVGCQCDNGYLLNGSMCVNVLDELFDLDMELNQKISNLQDKITQDNIIIQEYIVGNYTQLHQYVQDSDLIIQSRIISNFSLQQQYLQNNYSTLENMIKNQFSNQQLVMMNNINILANNIVSSTNLLQSYINGNYSQQSTQITANYILIEKSIISNVTSLNNLISNNYITTNNNIIYNFSKADSNLQSATVVIDQKMNIIQNQLSNQIIGYQQYSDNRVITTQQYIVNQINSLLAQVQNIYLKKVDYKC
ncbi:Hypothetical_protein [Hexamita inflata]|uniref:Hypothetical_protein n=1 Tax=Hexamita inflata TaxID=28002 RepID=A0AA86R1V9_9EUKA|nr:Hypothetical protein HINF_LOCUS56405 [Hexamita inflata]